MVQRLPYLRETPSQTSGPYVHIGLAPGAAGTSPGLTLPASASASRAP
jgi:protocatechuate 3,4-dioxygenase beta subunit